MARVARFRSQRGQKVTLRFVDKLQLDAGHPEIAPGGDPPVG